MDSPPTVIKSRDYWWGLIVLTVGTYAVLWRWPEIFGAWGIRLPLGHWFVDTFALLAASDAFAQGLNPYESNPLDLLKQPHWYSDWWFRLQALGLTRVDAPWLGFGLVLVFLLAALLVLRPESCAEMLLGWLALCSPALALGVNRANFDLFIFAALALAAWLLLRSPRGVRLAVPPLIAFLVGLKFFPLAAAAALPFAPAARREKWEMLAFMAGLAGLVLWGIHDDILRLAAVMNNPIQLYTFGARQIIPDDTHGRLATLAAVGVGLGLIAFWWRRAPELPAGLDHQKVVLFGIGAATITGCFFVGVGFNYRLVFGLLLLPLLWTLHREAPAGLTRSLALGALVGLPLLLWLDGFVCLLINAAGPNLELASVLALRRFGYGLVSWAWITVVLGLWVALARPVCRQLLSGDAK